MPRSLSDLERVSAHLLDRVPTVAPEATVGEVLERLRKEQWDSVHYIYVLTPGNKLLGIASIRELLWSKDSVKIREIMKPANVHVTDSTDQEHIAIKALEHNLKSVPVLERGTEKFRGAVPADKILTILHEEHTEDLLRSAGIRRTLSITDIYTVGLLRLVFLRSGWLFIGLLGGLLITLFMSSFEETLHQTVALAFFIPVLVYMTAAVGTQAQTLFIRSISLRHISYGKYFLKELATVMVVGVLSAALLGGFALFLSSQEVARVVFLTMLLSSVLGTLVSVGIPWALVRLKRDAALGAGPVATVLQDFLTIMIYFGVARLLL